MDEGTSFEEMKDWLILLSKSGKHPEYGYPMGEYLCRSQKEVEGVIKQSGMTDAVIANYHDLMRGEPKWQELTT